MEEELTRLKAENEELRRRLAEEGSGVVKREKIAAISAEVVDSNPYSRLMALKKMGICPNYEEIRTFTVAVVGLGGVGSVAAEMLTRCGVGRLVLFDYDKVELANMNRLFYTPEHAGVSKTEAARRTLQLINPDVAIEVHAYDVCSVDHFDHFLSRLSSAHLVLGCVDNFSARLAINRACLALDRPWFESGVSENAVSGHIQFVSPGLTACFECAPPLLVASKFDEKSLKRDGVCAASLPTTMAITSGLLVQNALKKLLSFGSVSNFVGYGALEDFFPRYSLRPNPECDNADCRKWSQQRKGQWEAAEARAREEAAAEAARESDAVVHEDGDEWGIEVEEEEGREEPQTQSQGVVPGLERQYDGSKAAKDAADLVQVDDEDDLDDLAAQLKAM